MLMTVHLVWSLTCTRLGEVIIFEPAVPPCLPLLLGLKFR